MPWQLAGLAALFLGLAAALIFSGAAAARSVADPGALVRWGLPISKAIHNVSLATVVGGLIFAVGILPKNLKNPNPRGRDRESPAGNGAPEHPAFTRALAVAAAAGAVWTLSAEAARISGEEPGTRDTSLQAAVKSYLRADRIRLIETITQAIEEKRGFRFLGRRHFGDKTKVVETICDVKVENGVVTELIGLTRDVSVTVEREALGISRARLIRRMVEDMPVPVVVLDRALRVVACSATWARSHGLTGRREALSRPLNALIEVTREMTSAIIEAMSGGTARVVLPFYDAEDGRQVHRTCVVVPWQCGSDAAGGVLMLVGEEHPPFATLDVADRALGRKSRGLMEILEAM